MPSDFDLIMLSTIIFFLSTKQPTSAIRGVWRYHRGKQNLHIKKGQTTQWQKEKGQTTIYKTITPLTNLIIMRSPHLLFFFFLFLCSCQAKYNYHVRRSNFENLKHFCLDFLIYLQSRTTLIGNINRVTTCYTPDIKFLTYGNDNLTYGQNWIIFKYVFDCIKCSNWFLIVFLELNTVNMHIIWIHLNFIFPSILFGHIHHRFFISAIYSNACLLCISLM